MGTMFVGREEELGILEDLYSNRPGCAVAIYGRRRVGKTSLVDRFCTGRRTVRIPFILSNEEHNVSIMMSEISRVSGIEPPHVARFEDALEYLSKVISSEKTVVFMDEFPYLVEKAPHVSSLLQHFIDHELKGTDSMLIICGSSVAMMKDQVENYNMPLYGRFMNRIQLRPLPYDVCELMHPGVGRLDALRIYMTVGGYPAYHEMMYQDTYRDCVISNFLGPDAYLSDEGIAATSRELKERSVMESILTDISGGSVNIKEIAEKEGLTQTMCGRYLNELKKLGMVDVVVPMGDADRKTKIFRIADPLVEFCHRIVYRNNNIATSPDNSKAFDMLAHDIDTFLGHRFEDVCAEYMRNRFICRSIGKWWGWNGKEVAEIDIVAETTDGLNEIEYIAECRFTKRPVGMSVFKDLLEKASCMKGQNNRRFILFSVSGFAEDVVDEAEERRDLQLVDLDGLFESRKID